MIDVVADPDAVGATAAQDFILLAARANGAFHVALSGGSTPPHLFAHLVARRSEVDWTRVVFWWGDERTVPPDHPDSNYGMAKRLLLDPLGIPPVQIHRMEGERDPEDAARDYEAAITMQLSSPPVLDYNLLGMGKDGHTASLFPGSPGLTERARWVIANHVDSPLAGGKTTRLTLTFPAIAAARHTRVLVTGDDKAATLAGVLEGPPGHYPSQEIAGSDVRWIVDEHAASKLKHR
jgi:6-phosphogluconolactonase